MECVLDWLRLTGEGAVHNVANKITKSLKYKIHLQ
jgi:hypothetical protein